MSGRRIALLMALTALPAVAEVHCSPERPVVFTGESLKLRAWPSEPPAVSKYQWGVPGGHISTNGSEAEWTPEGADRGRYEITVSATTGVGPESCTIVIFYQNRPIYRGTGGVVEPGASLLQQGVKEPSGYGMYSYVLFGEPASHSEIGVRPR